MIRHLRHTDIDKTAWDTHLARCPQRHWYGLSATLDAACPGWDALVDETTGARMPLPWNRKWGIAYVYQPFLLQHCGPYALAPGPRDAQRFLEALPRSFRYVDICLNGEAELTTITAQRNVTVDLRSSMDLIRGRYSDNLRRNLRRTEEAAAGWDAELGVDELGAFLEASAQFRQWGIDARRSAVMRRVFALAKAQGTALVRGVRTGGTLVAGALFVNWGGRLIFLKGLANERGRAMRAMHYLLDRVIAEHAGQELTLDLAGGNDPDLARFYLGFGGEQSVYLRATLNRLPPIIRLLKA